LKSCSCSIIGITLLALCGCGPSGPATAPTRGVVTVDGMPLDGGQVMFWPVDGGRPAGSKIAADGTYVLQTFEAGDGAVLGEHQVTVKSFAETSGPASFEEEIRGGLATPAEAKIPLRYAVEATSGLTATVVEGENEVNLELTSQ